MRITVTQEHFDRSRKLEMSGTAMRSRSCPVAMALRERFPEESISVHVSNLYLGQAHGGRAYSLPPAARQAILAFDEDTRAERSPVGLPLSFIARRRP